MNNDTDIETAYSVQRVRLIRMAEAIVGSHADAEDIVQSVILRIIEQGEPISAPMSYLNTAVRNEAVGHWRKLNARQRIEQSLPLNEEDIPADLDRLSIAVDKAVESQLAPAVRRVVRSVFYSGNSYIKAAGELGISPSTVNKHIVTALRVLRKYFKSHEL